MRWKKLNEWCITTGHWNITKATGVIKPYTLWDLQKKHEPSYHMTAEDAKTVCMELSKDAPVLQTQNRVGGRMSRGQKDD